MKTKLSFLLLLIPIISSAQKTVKLTRENSGTEIILEEGMRVVLMPKTTSTATVGILNKIYYDSLVVDDKTIEIEDISRIGRKKRGSGFWSVILAAFGGSFIGAAIAPDPEPINCNNCHVIVEDEVGPAENIVLIAGGVALIGWGIRIAVKNSAKEIDHGKWKLEVVE